VQRICIAIVVASLGWGTAGVATRGALNQEVTPYRLAAYRATLAVVVVIVYLVATRRPLPRGVVAWKVGFVMGTSNLAVPFITSTIALQYAGAGFIGLMTALIPLMTAALAHFLPLDERLSVAKVGGLLVGFAGVGVLLLSGDSGLVSGGRPVLAGVLALIAVASISAGSLYAKYHAGGYEPLQVTGLQHAIGAVVIAVAMLLVEGGPRTETPTAWLQLGYMAIFSSFVPMMLYYWLLTRVTATYASLAGYVIPVIAIAAGVLLLGEQLQPGIVAGGALILVGVIVTDRAERSPRPRRPLVEAR
jgi:drug/metabolite transporter (DMT)-like permease